MNENNANIKDENKEVKTPFCSSRFLMNKELSQNTIKMD